VIGIENERGVRHRSVVATARPLTCPSIHVVRGYSAAGANLLNVVSHPRICLTIISTGTLIREGTRHTSVIGSRRWRLSAAGGNFVARRVILRSARARHIERVSVVPDSPRVERHSGALVNVLLPGRVRDRFCANHGESSAEEELLRWTHRVRLRIRLRARSDSHATATISATRGHSRTIPRALIAPHIDTSIVVHRAVAIHIAVRTTAASHSLTVAARAALSHRLLVARGKPGRGLVALARDLRQTQKQ